MSFQGHTIEAPSAHAATAVEEARKHLFNDLTLADYRRSLVGGIDRVADRIARTERPFSGIGPQQLSSEVSGIDLDRPLNDPAAALDELEEVYLRDAVYFHHPRYLAHLNCPVVIPALLGEAVLTAVNSSLDTWDQSAGGTLIERRLIDWTACRIGFGVAADGVFTSGGSQSNLQALLLAREEALTRAMADTALPSTRHELLPRLRVIASEVSHFSVKKCAKMLGLDVDAVMTVPTDQERRMRPAALAAELERCRRHGLLAMAVVATAGTTDFGFIDPLPAIAELCEQDGTWLHVDAAYGCGLLVSPTRRHLLDGVERAHSLTVDYHKSFFQPVSSSALVVSDVALLRHATYYADYLNPARIAVGMALLAGGFGVVAVFTADGYGVLLLGLLLMGAGCALANPAIVESVLTAIPPQKAGAGAGIDGAMAEVGSSVGVAVLGAVLSTRFAALLPAALAGARSLPEALAGAADETQWTAVMHAFSHAIETAQLAGATAVLAGGCLAALLLRRADRQTDAGD